MLKKNIEKSKEGKKWEKDHEIGQTTHIRVVAIKLDYRETRVSCYSNQTKRKPEKKKEIKKFETRKEEEQGKRNLSVSGRASRGCLRRIKREKRKMRKHCDIAPSAKKGMDRFIRIFKETR